MKVFRLDEAAALLPTIRPLVDEMLQARRDLAIDLLEADAAQRMPPDHSGKGRTSLIEERARDHQMRIVETVEKIHSYGCIVKDVDLGLVDFPALRGGQLVELMLEERRTVDRVLARSRRGILCAPPAQAGRRSRGAPVSRVLYRSTSGDDHLSGASVTGRLVRRAVGSGGPPALLPAIPTVLLRVGFAQPASSDAAGALLPHHFTLTVRPKT